MGEARRRIQQGLSNQSTKNQKISSNKSSKKIISWLPITSEQENFFVRTTIQGGWIGIGLLILVWVVVRFIGPAAGWWIPADLH
tara:strand:+ start:28553 stop:28804 length:252 start_codon:yes stop_codon:yes gene_type:complete